MTGDRPTASSAQPSGPDVLPPGQRRVVGWPVSHYGPVPRFRPERWDLKVFGATRRTEPYGWTWDEVTALARVTVVADLHCAQGTTSTGHEWFGIPTGTILRLAPPAPDVTHVMAWAEYGFSANMRLSDFTAPTTLLATHRGGEPLTAEHGSPLRLVVPHLYGYKSVKWLRGIEYLTADRPGFWEERGYHHIGDVWTGKRYSYEDDDGDATLLRR
ncbi:molybdopterin-dependent oxidoreductase [Streptomyces sp. LP11]|uniref:Molybdopterin-dependent oxidoreductase n=1 Tax=Streptomyces pyxinicus TaxID=2970331 RepID=A0ABT2B7B6_9ACTN|nr:molybdopterin-dependent oxidoreductase [Streptomyces sp. LP11]MCS0604408.1 molybdopterin-dependent oxidoreductase [Streptomyces sp. LP11]